MTDSHLKVKMLGWENYPMQHNHRQMPNYKQRPATKQDRISTLNITNEYIAIQ